MLLPEEERRKRKAGRIMIPLNIWYDPYTDIGACVGAYQAVGGPTTFADTLPNLANVGTYDLTYGAVGTNAPAWHASTGWQFSYDNNTELATGITPEQDWTYVVRFTNLNVYNTGAIFGSLWLHAYVDLFPAFSSKCMRWYHGDDIMSREPMVTEGIFGMAGEQLYRNGVRDGDPGPGVWTGPAGPIYLGSLGASFYQDVYIQAFAIYSRTLNDIEMANVMNAMAML